MKITTLDEALERIKELEKEVAELKAENEKLRKRDFGGRKKHDEAWMAAYNDFMLKYESGMTLMEIVAEGDVSRRTAYRYLAYYRELQKLTENSKSVQK
ncbi:MAG: resolvase [Lachnospiraceae bacterium]|nr:resolvase [Lachnospiraceae bacterium]